MGDPKPPLILGGLTHAPTGAVAVFDAAELVRAAGPVRTLVEWAREYRGPPVMPAHVHEAVLKVARAIGART